MIARIDAWLGLRVFQPPAILLCWLLRCTQWRLNRDMWFIFGLYILYRVTTHGSGWAVLLFIGLLCLLQMAIAVLNSPHNPVRSVRWVRMVWLIFLVTDTVLFLITGDDWQRPLQDVWVLITEYAATITNLPPPPTFKVRRMKMEKQHAS